MAAHDDPLFEDEVPESFRGKLLQGLAKRLQDPRKLSGDAMELAAAVLETSDRAKNEMVRMVAREVRNYLEELKLKEDLTKLLTSHSLEVKMSLSLKPLAPSASPTEPPEPNESR